VEKAERQRRIDAVLESFRIAHLRRQRPGRISGGEQQRVAMARALVTDPGALLLDEPLTGLDLPTRSRLIDDLRAWNEAHRVPILYVTHAREEVFGLGEWVIVLEKGRVIAQGSPYEVLHRPRHELTAELAGVENLFDAVVVSLHENEGTMTCECRPSPGNHSRQTLPHLEAPLARSARPGMSIRLGIRAGDILLATTRPAGLSARNILPGKLVSLVRRDITAVATVDCGIEFEIHLTPAAETDLGLRPGGNVWVIIKTYSCNLLR
jgi:molybdate transport system ATP-binding protein